MSITREEANKCLKSLMRVLIIKEGDKYRPAKDTSRQDAYRALYEIQEALGTRRIEREEAILENMQGLELALSALRPVSREQVEKVWRGECDCSNSKACCTCCSMRCQYCIGQSEYKQATFCMKCGRPLTNEAVQMVMERMEALYEQKV